MSDKLYPSPGVYPNMNNTYNRSPSCSKQPFENNQQFYNYSNMQVNNTFNQRNNILEGYNLISPQGSSKNQNMYTYSSQIDLPNWDTRICDEALKISDKIEMIEITSKDLSPASYCSNLDLLMPDFYKSITKDLNYYGNKCDGQWSAYNCNNQNVADYPSCAQHTTQSNNNLNLQSTDKSSVKYCSIQKSQVDFDYNTMKNFGYSTNELIYPVQNNFTSKPISNNGTGQDYSGIYNYYEGKMQQSQQDSSLTQYFNLSVPSDNSYQPIVNTDQQTEGSNEESDIIVEESDEEVTDCNEYDTEKKFPSEVNCCAICNVSYTPLGNQFYFLTERNPLSMTSQKPVFTMVLDIVGKLCNKINYLCSECLGLVNTIDHLKMKLENFKLNLLMKFQRTCQLNNVVCPSNTMEQSGNSGKKVKKKKKSSTKYKCKICKKVLSLRKFCENHMKRHKFRGFLCELCGKIFKSKHIFESHQQWHLNKSKNATNKFQPYKCSNCSKVIRTKSNLIEHENYCLGLLPHGCKFCDKKFASGTKLKSHVKLKHDKKFIAICSICNIGFVKLSDYKSHKISHSTDKKFSCSKCDKSYKTLSNLNFHMKIHDKTLPFICVICSKGFMRKEYLEAHVNNHKGIKNFICTICDKKFVSQKSLDSHLKLHDGTVKTKTCDVCGKVMTTGFEEHLRIHNNLREYECDSCESRFNTKGTLAKHKKRKHAIVNDEESL